MNGAVNFGERDLPTLRRLASMPFLDRLELAAASGVSDRAAYDAASRLEHRGLLSYVRHTTGLLRTTLRYFPTVAGLRVLAGAEETALEQVLRTYPVSAQWRRILLERLDAGAVIYRLASYIAAQVGPLELRWYRALPLDAAMKLPDGRTVGVVRQGPTSDRTGFAKRLWRLRKVPLPGSVLFLMPDEVRLRQARRALAGSQVPALLGLERDAVRAGPADPVWRLTSVPVSLDLRQALTHVDRGGYLPTEPKPLRASLPGDIAPGGGGGQVHAWLLPAMLRPTGKRVLDLLWDWPGMEPEHVHGLLGVSRARLSQVLAPLADAGLVEWVDIGCRRLALSDQGLALLARRDRTSVGAARKRWSVVPVNPGTAAGWRNVSGRRSRQLLRNLEHTAAVHAFMAALAKQSRCMGWELALLDPPFRASRYFRYGHLPPRAGGTRSVHPDAFGVLRRKDIDIPFFLEWERRAVRPTTMAARLAPYLRYYSSHRPTDDHGAQPVVLVVFHDELPATHFLRVAEEEMDRAGVEVPLLVSQRTAIDGTGPLGQVWRAPGIAGFIDVLPSP